MHRNEVGELRRGQGADAPVVILVHGRNQTPAEARALAERLDLDGVRFLFPEADDKSWYPAGFMAPIADNEPNLSEAVARYEELVSGLIESGVPAGRIVVGGFSQGACLSAEFLARHPRRYGGAVIWTGGLIGPEGTSWPVREALAGMPVYLTTAENDAWVPAGRVRETEAWLKASGADVRTTIFAEREHGVLDEEIAGGRHVIESVR